MDPSDFLGKPITRDYRPGIVGASSRGYDQRGFLAWGDIEYMKRDPQVAFGLRILYSPLPQVKWKVKAKSEEVAKFVDRTIQKVWTNHLHDLADCVCYGHAGGEVLWRHDEETDTIEFDRLKPVHSPDLRPLECNGEFAGVAVQGVSHGDGGPGWIRPPRSLWVVHERVPGTLYGRSRLGPVWAPWQEKTARHGAIDVRRLWFVKNVFRGGVIRHPPGEIETAPGVYQSCQDYARELVEKMEAGGVLTLPNITDEHGNQLWTYEEPKVNGDLTGVREYTGDLDREILVALGIPPEVVDAADSGSGWSGRSVPFLVWLSSEDMIAAAMLRAIVEQICRPGVEVNYAGQWFEVEPVSLVPQNQMDDAAQAGEEGGGESAPAAPPPPPPGPDAGAPPVQMSSDGNWTRYEGSHGGKGWKHSGTGEIRYQEKQPSGGSSEEEGKTTSSEDAKTPEEARKITVKDLLKLPAAAAVGAKQAIARVGQPVWDTLSPKTQERLTKALKIGKAIEHKAMIAFHKGKELSVEVARQRGLGEEHAERVGRIIAIADQALAWTTTFPVVTAATGNPAVGKAASFLPMASLGYLAMSTARNPLAMWRAARAVFARKPAFVPEGPNESAMLSLDRLQDREAIAALLAGFDRHPEGEARDWYEALVYAALDATGGDLAEAVRLADEHAASNPSPVGGGDGPAGVQLSQDPKLPHELKKPEKPKPRPGPAGDPWVRYEGKRGGRGWRNTETGRIVYQEAKPGTRGPRGGAAKASPPHARPDAGGVAARVKQLRESGAATAEDIQDLAHQLMSLRVVDLQALKKAEGIGGGKLKAELVQKIRDYVAARVQAEAVAGKNAKPGRDAGENKNPSMDRQGKGGENTSSNKALERNDERQRPDRPGGPGVPGPDAGASRPVEGAAERPAVPGPAQVRVAEAEPIGPAAPRRVSAQTTAAVNKINRLERFFRGKNQHLVADWLVGLREHVSQVGAESALAAIGGAGEPSGDTKEKVQYWGVGTEEMNWKSMGEWMGAYLARNGIIAVTGDNSDPSLPLVSALGAPDKYVAGDFKPAGMHYADKLAEAKDLPGLETSEDITKILGKPVTHLTPEVTAALDAKYGAGKWIVKCYDENAAAGYGIFFPQRTAAIAADAKNTLWDAGSNLAQYGFEQIREASYGNFARGAGTFGELTLAEPEDEDRWRWDHPEDVKAAYSEKVLEAAKQGQFYIEPEKLQHITSRRNVGGLEHEVFEDQQTGRFWKLTKDGHFGQNKDLPEYLARHAMANQLWPELGYTFHGVTADHQGEARAVLSMNRVDGPQPSQDEIQEWFTSRGWVPEGERYEDDEGNDLGQWRWKDPATGTIVGDAHAKNFVRTSTGLVPIDVDILPGPDALKNLPKDEPEKVVGLRHSGGDEYRFGTDRYRNTINGDVRHWGDRAANAANHENGPMLPEGKYMAQPAFEAVGISDAERAAGKTWHEKNEGRVHLVTRPDGNVEVIPHSTWLKGGALPVVFEDDDTRAMAKAAQEAIAKLPPEARKGQVYAPDIMKTPDGYRVVELNAQGDYNGSGYLHDNHFTIDAYTSHLTGRVPAHVQFIRQLLTSRKGKQEKPAKASPGDNLAHTRRGVPGLRHEDEGPVRMGRE